MRRGLWVLACAVATGMMACGGGGGTSVHAIATNQSESTPAGTQILIGAFAVPNGAVVNYSIVDTPTGIGSDTMDVGVAVDATADTGAPTVYGGQTNVSSTTGSTQPLPADTYDLLINCNNIVDPCIFTASVTATY